MMSAGERAYAYAKACGIIGKSFVSRRIASLRPVTRLSELDRLVFGQEAKELPERELLPDLERRFSRRSVSAILSVVNSYTKPPELFRLLIQAYEYADLKTALALIAERTEPGKRPDFVDLGRFGTVRFDAWPGIAAMIGGTEFSFLLDRGKNNLRTEFDGVSLETALDRHYYAKLWNALGRLGKGSRRGAEHITAEEIVLRNCAWVLRLRTYYGMGGAETASHLVVIKENPRLSADAQAALDLPLDNREAWEGWKRRRFLNSLPVSHGSFWQADPRHFQNAASEYLYRLALRYFRQSPGSPDAVFCFIKLKQFEEDLLTSSAEGLGMGMTGKDVFDMLEAPV